MIQIGLRVVFTMMIKILEHQVFGSLPGMMSLLHLTFHYLTMQGIILKILL